MQQLKMKQRNKKVDFLSCFKHISCKFIGKYASRLTENTWTRSNKVIRAGEGTTRTGEETIRTGKDF